MYQVHDGFENTATQASTPTVHWTSGSRSGSFACQGADGTRGIGECRGSLPTSDVFNVATQAADASFTVAIGSVAPSSPLTAVVPGSTELERTPTWAQSSEAWNGDGTLTSAEGSQSPADPYTRAMIGVKVPYRTQHSDLAGSNVAVNVEVYLKTYQGGSGSGAANFIRTIKFLVQASDSCSLDRQGWNAMNLVLNGVTTFLFCAISI